MDYVWHYPKELDENGRAIYGGMKVTLLPTFLNYVPRFLISIIVDTLSGSRL